MYTNHNYQSKAALKRALDAGVKVFVHQPGGVFESQQNGRVHLEGPHFPQPHKWGAMAIIKNGCIEKLLK